MSPPMLTPEDVAAEVRAHRHVLDTRHREIALDVASARAELVGVRDALGGLEQACLGLAAGIARLERRLIPAAWSGVALGMVLGWAVAVILGGA